MKTVTRSLGFRLTVASFLVVSIFIFVAGVTVYKISQDAVKGGLREMVESMAGSARLQIAKDEGIESISDSLMSLKLAKSGAVWIMDRDGYLLFHPDPVYREEYIKRGRPLGNTVVSLQFASPRHSGQGQFREKLVDIIAKYEEGFGTYQQYGETKVLAFQVLKDKGWLLGLDEPVAAAYSELNRIRRYILYTGIISAALILAFTWLAIRIIVQPYYRETEELNIRLQNANQKLTDVNSLLEASNEKLKALYRISISMQETLSLQDILEMIASGAQEVLKIDRINIMLPDREEKVLQCRAAIGAGDRDLGSISVPLGTKGGALAAAYRRIQAIKVPEGEGVPPQYRLSGTAAEDPFLRSSAFVALPMVVKNKAVGVIALDNKVSRQPITDDMVSLIQIFANQAAVAVENARLYEELRHNLEELDTRVDQLAIVNQISNTMQKMVKMREMLGFILRGIKESMGFDWLLIALVDKEEEMIRGEVGVNIPEEKVRGVAVATGDEDSAVGLALSQGVPLSFVSTKEQEVTEILGLPLEETGLKESTGHPVPEAKLSLAVIPVMVLEETTGVIVLVRSRRRPDISKREMELLLLFANTAGLAVERARLYERLNEDAGLDISDPVSKLYTLKYGQQRLREELTRARETGRPLSLAMVGIDNFKEFNERSGQERGDQALRELGHLVKMVMFDSDLAFRYGGRLICCLLPGRNLEEAVAAAEKLRTLMTEHLFEGGEAVRGEKLTVSIGVYEFRGQDSIQSPPELFKMTMAHLHQAEAKGGNSIVSG